MSIQSKFRGFKEVWQFENRFGLVLTKLFSSEQLHVYRFKGMDILIDHAAGDANGAREVLTSPMYKRFFPLMKFDKPINVLDLGANNGGFPLLLQANNISLQKVVSLELNPKTFSRLRFNLERNLHCDLNVINAALCGQNKMLNLSLGSGSVSDSIYADSENPDSDTIQIEGLTMDEIWNRYFGDEIVDICKMDVEGAEFEVFLQPSHRRLEHCRFLIIEIHERGDRRAKEILPAIESLSFVRQPTEKEADPAVHFFINSKFVK